MEGFCPTEAILALISGKWKVEILLSLERYGALRPVRMGELIHGMGQYVLQQKLRELTNDGLLKKCRISGMPPAVEYTLTDQGKAIVEAIHMLHERNQASHERLNTGSSAESPEELIYIVSKRWNIRILKCLSQDTEPKRFGELCEYVQGSSAKVLTQQLRELISRGMVIRTQYPEMPPRVEYTLTPYGLDIVKAMMELRRFGYCFPDYDMKHCEQCGHFRLYFDQ